MNKTLLRAWFAIFVFGCILGLAISAHSSLTPAVASTPTPTPAPLPNASAAPTPASTTAPGTSIINAASATYSDGTNTYTIQSNTVTVYVQNAPSLVVLSDNGTSAGTVGMRYPGDTVTEYYTLVNTGNGTGAFTVSTMSTAGLVASAAWQVSCTGGSGLNDYVATTAALNTDLANAACSVAAGGVVNLAAFITTNGPAGSSTTFGSSVGATITYSGTGTGYSSATSASAGNTYSDPLKSDEEIDIQKSPAPLASDGTVTYTVTANNSGYGSANAVQSYGGSCGGSVTVCGTAFSGPGILISDKVPVNTSNAPLPVVSMSPSPGPQATPNGTILMVYTTDTTAKTGWAPKPAGTFPPTTRYVGVWIQNGSIPGDPTPAATTQPGNVAAASSQIGFSVQVGPVPAGLTVTNVITAPVGDNKSTPCIEGPGLTTTYTSCDGSGGNPGGDPSISLATTPPGNNPIPGLSNLTSTVTPSLYNGPLAQPDAQGCFNSNATPVPLPVMSPNAFPTVAPTTAPTCAATDNMDDYTQAVATPNPAATGVYLQKMANAGSIIVTNGLKNPGSQSTSYQLTFPTLPSTLTVSSVTYGSGACSSTATPSAGVYPLGSVAAGATIQYCVQYTTATGAGAPYYFQPQYVQLRVAYTSAPSVYYNDTWNVIMPDGFVEIAKTANMVSAGCGSIVFTGGLPSTGVCPGGVIQYALAYYDTLPIAASGTPAEPAAATLAMSGNLVITEDGAANGSNWTTYTGGLFDPSSAANPLVAGLPFATMQASCGVTTLKCGASNASATFGQVSGAGGNALNATKFTVTVPSSGIAPQIPGTVMFATKVQ
jgi:hypothetical protein